MLNADVSTKFKPLGISSRLPRVDTPLTNNNSKFWIDGKSFLTLKLNCKFGG